MSDEEAMGATRACGQEKSTETLDNPCPSLPFTAKDWRLWNKRTG